MVCIFCRGHHDTADAPCEECQALLDYAIQRLERCPFGTDKPTCAKCPIHCYKQAMRERIRTVMRYAGPRMLARHPVLALRHCLDGAKLTPKRPVERLSSEHEGQHGECHQDGHASKRPRHPPSLQEGGPPPDNGERPKAD
ncbi:MAG: nitrous oxide-stimulated promoter family protein [Pirellulaceae bacterium]|nr:nitrous oxide-stimulated promoter family protein [Pirellulaceae bacterium]